VDFALSAIGRDRPGIVAGISAALLELGGNIDDSQMSILHGHFAVMLIVSVPPEVERADLERRLAAVAEELELEGIAVSELAGLSPAPPPTHVLTVYGADHPGIVHAVAQALADRGANISDLKTRRTGQGDDAVYVMVMEVSIAGEPAELVAALAAVGERSRVEVSLRELDADAL
jgi:glycine cleavage system transcriptional repressor